MTSRSEPWPESLVLTTVSKLKPKSTLVFPIAAVSNTGATDCAVMAERFSPPPFAGPSCTPGFAPPTSSVTATMVAPLAWVRKVWTGNSLPVALGRDEVTVSLTTRTV